MFIVRAIISICLEHSDSLFRISSGHPNVLHGTIRRWPGSATSPSGSASSKPLRIVFPNPKLQPLKMQRKLRHPNPWFRLRPESARAQQQVIPQNLRWNTLSSRVDRRRSQCWVHPIPSPAPTSEPRPKYPPALTDAQRMWLRRQSRCFKCQCINIFHDIDNCLWGCPKADTYQGITLEDDITLANLDRRESQEDSSHRRWYSRMTVIMDVKEQ